MESIKDRIIKKLQEQNMTQKELAQRTDLTEATISRLITGKRCARAETVCRIASALNCTTDYLLNGIGDGKPKTKEEQAIEFLRYQFWCDDCHGKCFNCCIGIAIKALKEKNQRRKDENRNEDR